MTSKFRIRLMATAASVLALAGVSCTNAQAAQYDLPAEALGQALKDLAHKGNVRVLAASDLVAGKTGNAVVGARNADEALSSLLAGTGLHAELVAGAYVIRRDRSVTLADSSPSPPDKDIVVTGTRIQKGAVASPIITLSQQSIQEAGQTDIGDALRSLPENFNGGQNPGVVPGIGNSQNIGGGSSPNLRGLGPDATLTLLNGHRLAYGSFQQAVDIADIPLAAVDRVDIVPDGASAIYGSDAVGGVVNVLLKRDFEGLTTSARVGAAMDGGDTEQQYDATAGHRWGTGGVIATYDFQRNTAIESRQRSYTASMPDGSLLYPSRTQHSGLVSAHQTIGSIVSVGLDATYNRRTNLQTIAPSDNDLDSYHDNDRSYSIAPWIKAALGAWTVTANGVIGDDKDHYHSTGVHPTYSTDYHGFYGNSARVGEVDAEGPLIHLGGGDVRAAIGGGYRWNGYHEVDSFAPDAPIKGSEKSYYAFGELFAPIVSPAERIGGVNRLSIDAAIRYERYPGMAQVATPKLGLVYAPTRDFELKASWGRSFKAPTLFQLYEGSYAYLYSASTFGGTRFLDTATALDREGGNPDLKPEHATSWSITAEAHPQALPGTRLSISYFHIDYRNRIVQPFSGPAIFTALSDPASPAFVSDFPTPAEQAAVIDSVGKGFASAISAPYDPANVVAIIDDRYVNAETQRIRGVDVAAETRIDLAPHQDLTIQGAVSWLDSHQQISSGTTKTPLSGTIYNPPHWRGRASARWSDGQVTVTPVLNYIGSLSDPLTTPHSRVRPMTTVDITAVVALKPSSGLTKGVSLTLTVRNFLNEHPPYAAPSGGLVYYVPYDPTNYSAIGRFVGLTVTKAW